MRDESRDGSRPDGEASRSNLSLFRASERGQSETVGVILLTAVIVIVVGGFGAVYLGAAGGDARASGPLVDAHVTATADDVSITHAGGESVATEDLDVLIRTDDDSERYTMDVDNVTRGDDDDQFEPTECFARSHGVGGGQLEVMLIHTDSNAVLEQAYLDI